MMTAKRTYPLQVSTADASLKIILDASPVGLIVFDHEACVIYANTLAEQIFSASANRDAPEKLGDFIACPHRQTDAQGCGYTDHCLSCPLFRAVRWGGEQTPNAPDLEGEALLSREPGRSDLWVQFKVNPIQMGDRKVAIMTVEDITLRKRAEKAVRDRQERFKLMFMNAPMPYQSLDDQGNFLEVNQTFLDVLGYSEEELIGRNFGDILHPDWVEHFKSNFPRFMAIGEILGVEFEMVKKDGSTILVFFNGRIQRDVHGRFERTHCIFQDITGRRLAEVALQEREAMYRKIFENAPVGIFQTTPQGRFLSANPEYARIAGYANPEEMIEQVSDIGAQLYVRPEDRKRYQALLQKHGQVRNFEVELRRRDGSTFWVSMNTKALKNREGDMVYDGFLSDVTERVRAEQALRKTEALQRAMIANIADVIAIIDQDGVIRFKSANIEKWFGWRPEDLLGTSAWNNVHPDDLEGALKTYAELMLEPSGTRTLESRYRCKDGTYKWTSFAAVNLLQDPDIKGFLLNYRDITERKQAEDALRESERHLHKVFDILPVGLWFADKDGTLLRGNPTGIKIWGAEPLVDPCDYGIFKARRFPSGEAIGPTDWSLYQTIRNGVTIVDEILEIDAFDGEKRVILNSTAPVLDEQGNVQGAIVVNQDITARQRAEADLKRIEWMLSKKPASAVGDRAQVHDQGYGDLTELNRSGVVLKLIGPELLASFAHDYLDLLGTSSAIYEANGDYAYGIFASGWCRMMDRASRKLCDTPDNAQAVQSGKWLCHESCWTHCARQAIAKRAPMDIACHGGIRLYGVPILANGQIAGVINFGYGDPPKDPAHLRQLAEAYGLDEDDLLREARAYDSRPPYIIEMAKSRLRATAQLIGSILEAKLAEKARQKLQDQLYQSQKMESVGRLAGGVAHDYNNMLSVIIGYTEMAMDKMQPDDPLHADLTEIFKAARRSIDITRQLLAFARKQTIAPTVVDLNAIVESMLRMLGRLIGEDIDLAWLPGKHLWSVKIDPAQIDQVLANLCVNARDAIGGVGKVTIETGNSQIDEAYCDVHAGFLAGEYVMLAVSDNGCGMDEETLGNIFEPFFTTKGVAEGTGLGLATVYGIVKQNNGFINVYSEPGQGTSFRIYLPRHVGQQHQMQAAAKIQTPMGRGETVLLVEDEPSIMRMTRMMLNRLGYQVLAAGTPSQALALADRHGGGIDLLITDVVMPEMSGRNLADQVHARHPGIKTLFMSGYTANVIAHNGVLDEGVNFIQKPFSLHDFGIKVMTVLKA